MIKQYIGLVLSLSIAGTASASMTGNTYNITLGQTRAPSWTSVVNANYGYVSPKQTFNSTTGATTVYMPYGNTDGVYYALDHEGWPIGGASSELRVASAVGTYDSHLIYKLHFDKAIAAFTYYQNLAVYNLTNATASVGIQYSTDGTTWHNIRQTTGPVSTTEGTYVNNTSVSGLNTKDLYIKYYASDPGNANHSASEYFAWRQAGAGNWGEANFWNVMPQLTITSIATPEPASLALFGIGALTLIYRRRRSTS